jgi:glycosyltransferase involved in cell wall biosynthesis
MRVAFYSPYSPGSKKASGEHIQARAAIAALERQGNQVRVVSEFKPRYFWRDPRRIVELPRALWDAYREVRTFRPDAWLTLASSPKVPDVLGPLVSRRFRIPYVIWNAPYRAYEMLRQRNGPRDLWLNVPGIALNRLAFASADHIVVSKVADYDRWSSHPKVARKLSLLWPAVSAQEFAPSATAREQVRHRLRIPVDVPLLLSVSRFSDLNSRKARSVQFAIDCTGDIRRDGHPVRLIIVGDGKARAELEAHAADQRDAVIFTGSVDHAELNGYYNAADLFVFPGLREPIGMVYLEAQAAGLPVVAFRNGGIPGIVKDGETGFLVGPRDRRAFVERVEQLLNDDQLRSSMSRAGRAHVEEHHELQRWGARLSALLTS